jgi:hypothetical protein
MYAWRVQGVAPRLPLRVHIGWRDVLRKSLHHADFPLAVMDDLVMMAANQGQILQRRGPTP